MSILFSSTFIIDNVSIASKSEWQLFVENNAGNYCHRYEWRTVLEQSYNLQCYFLMLRNEEKILGILPLGIISTFFGKKAVSLPYCNYGGLLSEVGADKNKLFQSALTFLKKEGIDQVEIRDLGIPNNDYLSSEVTLILKLPDLVEILWKNIGDKARNQIRKAERSGLIIQWGHNQADELYDIYAENMGRLGTPVHSRSFIYEILKAFGEHSDILTVRLQEKAISAMLIIKHGDTWIDPIASTRVEFNKLNPNMLLYWEALKQATLAGAKNFDFGRSKKDSGTYRFKRQWGAIEIPLDYYSYVNGIRVDSVSTDVYRGDKAAIFAKIWSKLPKFLQRYLGPKIRKFIP